MTFGLATTASVMNRCAVDLAGEDRDFEDRSLDNFEFSG